jgi:hypothetical protein
MVELRDILSLIPMGLSVHRMSQISVAWGNSCYSLSLKGSNDSIFRSFFTLGCYNTEIRLPPLTSSTYILCANPQGYCSCRLIIPLVSDNNTLICTSILGASAVKNQVPKVAVENASIGIQLCQAYCAHEARTLLLLSICPRSAVVCAPLLHIALFSLRSLSRVLGVVSFFGFFSLQWSIFHLFQKKEEEHPK